VDAAKLTRPEFQIFYICFTYSYSLFTRNSIFHEYPLLPYLEWLYRGRNQKFKV